MINYTSAKEKSTLVETTLGSLMDTFGSNRDLKIPVQRLWADNMNNAVIALGMGTKEGLVKPDVAKTAAPDKSDSQIQVLEM